MIIIPKDTISKYPTIDDNIFLAPDGYLYKICRFCLNDQRRNFLKYVHELEKIPGLLQPIDLLKDKDIYGYKMPYLKDQLHIKDYLDGFIEIDIKKVMFQIITILESIHKYFIFGDVRNNNIFIKDNNVTFIDWENGIRLNTSEIVATFYEPIIDKNLCFVSTKLVDSIKAYIICLSIYFRVDVEEFARDHDLIDLMFILKSIHADDKLVWYLQHLIEHYLQGLDSTNFSFDNIIGRLSIPNEYQRDNLKKILKK